MEPIHIYGHPFFFLIIIHIIIIDDNGTEEAKGEHNIKKK